MRSGPVKMQIERVFQDYQKGKTGSKKPGNRTVSPELLLQAAQGNPAAEYRLACCYADGIDVLQDRTTACLWFERAADSGHVASMRRLGEAYLDGDGIEKNCVRGLFWMLKAANRSNRDACAFLGTRYTIGHGLRESEPLASKWYRRAANLGSVSGILGLSRCYAGGLGVGQDLVKAHICLSFASMKAGGHLNFIVAKMKSDGMTDEQITEILRVSATLLKGGRFDF